MPNTGDVINFDIKKQLKYIKPLGEGGTGDTHLFKDETTDMLFAIKKYSPKDISSIDEYYKRFVDEIKILFRISHSNIVRIYNYYLYPDQKVGYLQMEYIDGVPINEYKPFFNTWENVFKEIISAFDYLEKNKILHRDIRPQNVLIDYEDNVKVIDFGFGKELTGNEKDATSILLNWPVTEYPEEIITNGIYNHQTEIYFIGKLIQHVLGNNFEDFKYKHILSKMISISAKNRFRSFAEIIQAISKEEEAEFSPAEKIIYQIFADALCSHINKIYDKYEPINDIPTMLRKIAIIIKNNSLEEFIQNNTQLIKCFITSGYNFKNEKNIKLKVIKDFYQLMIEFDSTKQKIVLDNINNRLASIPVELGEEQMPF